MKEMIKKYKGTLICSVLVMLAGILVGFTMAQSIWINVFFVVTDCILVTIIFYDNRNRQQSSKWGQIGNNYLKSLFAIGFQGFLIMVCVGIYAVLVNSMIIADNLHSAIFSLAAYTVILCFSLFKSGALAKSIFNAH